MVKILRPFTRFQKVIVESSQQVIIILKIGEYAMQLIGELQDRGTEIEILIFSPICNLAM